jgi:hypothetical protein
VRIILPEVTRQEGKVAEAKPVGLAGQSVEPVRMITRRGQARQHPWDLPVEVAQVCTHNVRKLRASECCDSDKGDETHARRWCRYRIQCRHSDAMHSVPLSVLNSTNLLNRHALSHVAHLASLLTRVTHVALQSSACLFLEQISQRFRSLSAKSLTRGMLKS